MDVLQCKYDKNQVGMFIWAKIPDNWKDAGELSDNILYEKRIYHRVLFSEAMEIAIYGFHFAARKACSKK